jgi:hypothetical protein
MTHLLVHLVKEIIILGLVFLHKMWIFNRFMTVLKKCILNRAHREGSIAKGYGTAEVIEFCVDFVDSIEVLISRHKERLQGKSTIRRKSSLSNDTDLFYKENLTVLQQSSLVSLYIEEYKQIISSQIQPTEARIICHHLETFPSWSSEQLICKSTIHPQLTLLALGLLAQL